MKLTLEQVLEKYQSNIYKAAFYICKHHDDAEDIAQEAFLAYFKADQDFESEEHIKAWLLRVTVNKAKNLKTSFWHRTKVSVPDFTEWLASRNEESEEGISETSENLMPVSTPGGGRRAPHPTREPNRGPDGTVRPAVRRRPKPTQIGRASCRERV